MFIFQIAMQTWLGLSPEEREELESNDFEFIDLLEELQLKFM